MLVEPESSLLVSVTVEKDFCQDLACLFSLMLLLFYYRTYVTQDVAAEVFGVGQATVSRSIDQIAPVVAYPRQGKEGL